MGRKIKILISFEDAYRSYREVIAATICILRPHAVVATSELDALGEELARFAPSLVICSCLKPASSGDVVAWVEISLEVGRPSMVYIGGRCSEQSNLTLQKLLAIIDEVEQLIQTSEGLRRS
jgi:hypothetical protein